MVAGTDEFLSAERLTEFQRCSDPVTGFRHFCENFVYIEDKETHRAIKFELYDCQKETADRMVRMEWLRVLKARRLGITWLCVVFAVWLCTFFQMRTVGYIVHKKEFAYDFIQRCKFVWNRLPAWMQQKITNDTKGQLVFDKDGHGCWIRALAATHGAADSLAADVMIIDQAPQIDRKSPGLLRDIQRSTHPTVETSGGAIFQVGTSEGPSGTFYDGWQAAEEGEDKYTNVFYAWWERPGRDHEWYEKEEYENRHDPNYMPLQYPSNPDEAFSYAQGRVYPSFKKESHVFRFTVGVQRTQDAALPQYIPDDWVKYRAFDWGGVDPFVALWGCLVPGEGPGLSVDPSCVNTIRELHAYRYKENLDYPEDRDNHTCDALRYLCVTFGICTHLHIYREIYIPYSAERFGSLLDLAELVKEKNGSEKIKRSVADRSSPTNMKFFRDHGIKPLVGQTYPEGEKASKWNEIRQGVVMVNALIVASQPFKLERKPSDMESAYREWRADPFRNAKCSRPLDYWVKVNRLKAWKARRRKGHGRRRPYGVV